MILPVQREHIPAIWPDLKPLVDEASEYGDGDLTTFDIFTSLLSQKMQLWVVYKNTLQACAVTELVNGKTPYCRIVLVSGKEVDQWLDELILTIAAWAKECGRKRLKATGRRGWLKKSSNLGVREVSTNFVMDL